MYLKSGKIKIKIATARGKTTIDKRHSIKERDEKRRMAQVMKKYR
jgi:SsrA-binding protein